MKILLDTLDIKAIEEFFDMGIVDGITTNPSLISKSGIQNIKNHIKDIAKEFDCDLSVEVVSTQYEDMVSEGSSILEIADNIVIKLPCTWDGIKACKYFLSQKRYANITLCFSVNQAFIASKAGAKYVSPFIGRSEDISSDGINILSNISSALKSTKTITLASSVRTVFHIQECIRIGVDAITLSPNILKKALFHPLTEQGLKDFTKAWEGLSWQF